MSNLYQRSIEIILENQSASGAYIASPNFPTYHYCWFRDGSFIAHAMDLAGQYESAHHFHQWVTERVNERKDRVVLGLAKARSGAKLSESEILHTRYSLDGTDGEPGNWPNFQLDGFGTWLWALNEHQKRNTAVILPQSILDAADLVADYLSGLWSLPCYDCWEEFPDTVHPHTLAAIYGGLIAYGELTGRNHQPITETIRNQLIAGTEAFGHFVKFHDSPAVDASLLGLSIPYGVVPPEHPVMLKTVEQIESTILHGSGLHRYATDSYFGGGAWILLTAWLAWYWYKVGEKERAWQLRRWIEAQAGEHGWLPEQVPITLNDGSMYAPWVRRWGPIANPLLWSHAEYLILCSAMQNDA